MTANVIRTALPGIILFHDRIELAPREGERWEEVLARHGLCFVTVVERHGMSGRVAHGLLKDFGLADGAVASSVGHDAHNIILAGRNAADMQVALEAIRQMRGGVCVVRGGRVVASVALPVAGLISDKRARDVAAETTRLKQAWREAGCTLPYMGFNLIPLSVIPRDPDHRQGLGHGAGDEDPSPFRGRLNPRSPGREKNRNPSGLMVRSAPHDLQL